MSQGKGIFVQVAGPAMYMWLRVNKEQASEVLRTTKAQGHLKLEAFENENSVDLVVMRDSQQDRSCRPHTGAAPR